MTVVLRRPAYEVVQQGQAAMNSCLVELSSAGDTAPLPHPRPEVGWFHLHEIKAALVSKLFNVYVLAAAASDLTKFSIAKRSAIVASVNQRELEHTLIYYEGNIYGASNLQHYTERLSCAAGRAAHHYPTMAMEQVPSTDLTLVGTYDLDSHQFKVTDQPSLDSWLDGETVA